MGNSDGEISSSRGSTPTLDEHKTSEACDNQPAPPGTNDIEEFPFLKALKLFEEPLIGLEFVMEQRINCKKSNYMCLLCNNDTYDEKSIFQHLTSQKHYLTYLEQYFPTFFLTLQSLKAAGVSEDGFKTLVCHLIGKLEEIHGFLRPMILRDSVLQIESLRTIMLNNNHLRENSENEFLKEMLKLEYIKSIDLLQKNFPLKSSCKYEEVSEVNSKICNSQNEIVESIENQNLITSAKSDNTDTTPVPMDLATSSSSEKFEVDDEAKKPAHVGNFDSVKSRIVVLSNSTKERSKKLPIFEKQAENSELQSLKYVSDVSSDHTCSPKVSETFLKSGSQPSSSNEKKSSSHILEKRRNKKKNVDSRSPRRRYFSRSRSPSVKLFAASKIKRRNYRKKSTSSSSPSAQCRLRSRSLSREKRYSSSSCSSSSFGSTHRAKHRRDVENRYHRNSYEYRENVREVKFRSRSKYRLSYERSHSPSPKTRSSPRRRSHSNSPKRRLRRMLAHETVSKNTGCVVRFDAAKSISSCKDGNDTEHMQHKVARVTLEVQSTVNSEKPREEDKLNVLEQKIRALKKNLQKERRAFKKRPETYPSFAEEWKIFWCNRFKQIEDEGKENPHSYDYRKDWAQYWLIRIKQIYKEKYKKMKSELKNNVGISMKNKNVTNSVEVVEISDDLGSVSSKDEGVKDTSSTNLSTDCQNTSNSGAEENESTSAASALSTETMQQLNFLTQSISACISSACSQTPLRTIGAASHNSTSATVAVSQKSTPAIDHTSSLSDDSVNIDLKNDLNLISVLRQLSVLETQLGSSATGITNLLGNGLAREKKQPGSSVRLLTRENRLFLDVIKEKLKGQLILEVVPETMIRATKKCIKSIDELMQFIPEPKVPDIRHHERIPDQRVESESTRNLPVTNHVPYVSRNTALSSSYTLPTATTHSVPSDCPPGHILPVSEPSILIPQPSNPVLQPLVPQLQYPTRSEAYPSAVTCGISPSTAYPINSVNSTVQMHSAGASAAPLRPTATHQQSVSNKTSSVPPYTTKHSAGGRFVAPSTRPNISNKTSVPPHTAIPADQTLLKSIRKPRYEQPVVAEILAAGPPSRPSNSGSSCHPSVACSADPRLTSSTSSARSQIPQMNSADPRFASPTSSARTQISRMSTSIRSQIPFSNSSTTHSRLLPVTSNSSNFQSSISSLTSGDFRTTSVNVTSGGCRVNIDAPTSNINSNAVTSVLCTTTTTPVLGNHNSTTTTPAYSQVMSTPSLTTTMSTVIDLTDDSPELDEDNEPVSRLSELQLIQLLTNFRQLPRTRQQELVDFLRKLEETNLALVERYKKYVM